MKTGDVAAEALAELLSALRDAERVVLDHCDPAVADAELRRAEGYRFVTRILRSGLELFVENSDPARPSFVPLLTPTRKGIGDNPDVLYDYAPLDGRRAYRIRGERGAALYLAFCFYAGGGQGAPPQRAFANLCDRDLDFAPDGSFEIQVAPGPALEPARGSWVEAPPDASCVVARQYFLEREGRRPASYRIESLPPSAPPPPLQADDLARRLRAAAAFVRTTAASTASLLQGVSSQHANAFLPPISRPQIGKPHPAFLFYGTPDNVYRLGWFRLSADEALVVQVTPPRGRYWSVHLSNAWFESLDFASHPNASLNQSQAVREPDGSLRITVAARDPGVPNWLDTAGHSEGYLLFRWLLSDDEPTPTGKVIPRASLPGA
jgi:hypothetical protein